MAASARRLAVDREEALLLRAVGGPDTPVGDLGAGPPLDWLRLVALARWHRVSPLLWELVRDDRGAELGLRVPGGVIRAIRDDVRRATARSLNLQFELERVLRVFAAESIPAVLLKGAALVESVYPHPGLRPMVDLDLLVRREDLERAHSVVASTLGYELALANLDRDDELRLATSHHHFPLVRQGGAVMVELHHRLLKDRAEYTVDGLWERARPSDAPPPHLLPAPEDLALHVAVHFSLDRINRRESALGQLADLVRIDQRWDLDWDAIAARARAGRVADRLFLALEACRELFGDLAPAPVLEGLRPASYTPELGAAFVRQRVLNEGPSLPLEQIQQSGGRRLFPGRGALEVYVRLGEPTPSLTRLRLRRWGALGRRLVAELPGPRALAGDARLSRWITTLQD